MGLIAGDLVSSPRGVWERDYKGPPASKMATGGSAKVVEDPEEASAFPESSPKNGVPGGEEVLEIENPIEFIDPLPNDFECSLCLQYLKQPALTSCGHHFCKECIDRAVERSRKLKQDPACPLCKEQDFQMFIDRKTERKISSLRVYCLKKSRGCRWEGELGCLNHHMDLKEGDCVFVEVECEFSEMGCTTRVLRKDMLKHMEENTHKHIILMSVLGSKMGGSLELNRKLQERRAEMLPNMQLCHRDEEFQQRLEGLEKKLEMKSEDMEQQLKVKDQELANVGERLEEKDDQLAEVKGQLQEKGKQLSKIEEQVKQLSKVEEQVKEKEGRLSVVEKKLGEKEKQLIIVEQRLKEKDKEQAEVKKSLQEQEQHIQELQNSLQRKEEQANIKRKLQEQQDGMQRQLQTSENDLKQRIVQLEKQLQEKDRNLEKELGAQIMSVRNDLDGRCPFLPFDFVMPNFTKLKASNTTWYSPPFYTQHGGYRLSLRVDANGLGSVKRVGWCLYTEPGEYDELLKWPRVCHTCYIQLLNHCTGKWEREQCCAAGTFKKPAPARRRQCFDCWHHIPHSGLEYNAETKTQYLKNDCLHFRITKIDFRD